MDKDLKQWYQDNGLTLPSSDSHGSDEDIRKRLQPLKAKKWHLDGNRLIMSTEMGEVITFIPPDYICTGVDDDNLPILQKIEL